MKRSLRSVLFACLFLSILCTITCLNSFETSVNAAYNGEFVYGDLNGDGNFNSLDAAILQRYLLEILTEFPSPNGMKAADVNGDGRINSLDYSLFKRHILGIIEHFPVEDVTPIPEPVDKEPPTVPQNVQVEDRTMTTVTLKWDPSTDNVGVAGYNVYFGNTKMGTTDDTTITLTGLLSDRKYIFSVTAFDESGNESDISEYVEVTTLSGASSPPGFVQVEAGKKHSLGLKEDGTVWLWGFIYKPYDPETYYNDNMVFKYIGVPTKISELENITCISAGSSISMALDKNGDV